MRKPALAVAAIAALSVAQPASADVYCGGTISHSWVDINGNVFVWGSWRQAHTQICNLTTAWKEVAPEICAAWLAKADAAVSLGRQVLLSYPTESSCAALPQYGSTPAPAYLMLN